MEDTNHHNQISEDETNAVIKQLNDLLYEPRFPLPVYYFLKVM